MTHTDGVLSMFPMLGMHRYSRVLRTALLPTICCSYSHGAASFSNASCKRGKDHKVDPNRPKANGVVIVVPTDLLQLFALWFVELNHQALLPGPQDTLQALHSCQSVKEQSTIQAARSQ